MKTSFWDMWEYSHPVKQVKGLPAGLKNYFFSPFTRFTVHYTQPPKRNFHCIFGFMQFTTPTPCARHCQHGHSRGPCVLYPLCVAVYAVCVVGKIALEHVQNWGCSGHWGRTSNTRHDVTRKGC